MTLPIQNQTQASSTPLWTVEEVAAYLQLAPETVRSMARSGGIPSMKLGKRLWRFDPGQIKSWLETTSEGTPA